MAADAPKRRYPRKSTRDAVRKRQNNRCGCRTGECGRPELPPDGLGLVQYQHEPMLDMRQVLPDLSDWVPSQHDPNTIFAELRECHLRETNKGRSGATTMGSDKFAKAKKDRILEITGVKPKHNWGRGQKLRGKGFEKGKSRWPNGRKLRRK